MGVTYYSFTKTIAAMCRKKLAVLWVTSALLFLIYLPPKIQAQEEFLPPPAKHITIIPFTMLTGGVIIVHALLDTFPDTLNFVLDTGSGGISLDSTTCSYFHIKTQMTDKVIRGLAAMKTVAFTYNHVLHFPGLDVDKLDFHINDYYILTSVYGLRIDGIIGYSFLRRYIVSIDYDKSKLDVFTTGFFKYPRGGYLLHPTFSTLPKQDATIKDEREVNDKFYFDTGAGLCLLLNDYMVKDSLLLKRKRKLYPTEAEGLGGKENMNLTVIKELTLGPYHFRKIPTYIFKDEYNVTSYPELGGLIGNDILRRFNVILNYPDQQIFIKPNSHFTDSFDYSYTGFSLFLENGNVTIEDIMQNSPAQKAGLEDGDIILGIDNNISRDIQQFKTLLQNANFRLQVIISRNEEIKTIYLHVGKIS